MRLRYALLLAALPLLAPDASAQCTAPAPRTLATAAINAPLSPSGTLFFPNLNGQHFRINAANADVFYAAAPWIGGKVNGELRVSAQTYIRTNDLSYQPGPLSAQGTADGCSRYNRVWIVTKADLDAFYSGGSSTADLAEWPWDLGAPVTDGDGVPGNYNLAGGDRPTLWGEATAWYVLNDVAHHPYPDTNSIGLEVQVTVGSANRGIPGALLVRHRLVYKPTSNTPLTDVYFGMWSDGDLGNPNDDYVGTDSTLSLFYYYNADNNDDGTGGFGSTNLPAAGVQILQGPRVDTDGNGSLDATLRATSGLNYYSIPTAMGFPQSALGFYQYMQALWLDGVPVTEGGNGRGRTERTRFVFPAMPPAYWSEEQPDVGGSPNVPGDRRGLLSAGPFTMQPGQTQDILSAFSFAYGSDRFVALQNLKAYAATLLQTYSVANEADARPELAVALGPNPTRGTLRGTVPTGQPATVALYDLLGRELRTLATLPSGGSFTADVSEATPGVYLVRIAQGTATAWHRLVVVR
ncbi:MAG: T9SS type A sorting domain-containing protein [Rhodothermales bacterium]|nr:T9SS type A sorting domain-containing protein [Rhodothermales bacterium]